MTRLGFWEKHYIQKYFLNVVREFDPKSSRYQCCYHAAKKLRNDLNLL
jgi:hypothetical protein